MSDSRAIPKSPRLDFLPVETPIGLSTKFILVKTPIGLPIGRNSNWIFYRFYHDIYTDFQISNIFNLNKDLPINSNIYLCTHHINNFDIVITILRFIVPYDIEVDDIDILTLDLILH